MHYIDNILIGPFRVFLLFLAVLFTHQIITKQTIKNYNIDYIIKRITIYGSSILLLIFILVQLNMYDLFTLLLILFTILGVQYLQLSNHKSSKAQLKRKRIAFLLGFFKFMEDKKSLRNQFKNTLKSSIPKKINYVTVAAFAVSLACFISRYLFLENDLYTLSDLWLKNLKYVKQLNYNEWFSSGFSMLGENALINFFSKITGISEEMAVHSFGLIEIFGVCFLLYWIIAKITKSKFIAPIAGVLFISLFYKFIPININSLLKHNEVYMAIWFALPAMLYTVTPQLLTKTKNKYFFVLLVTYSAIAFVNIFVAFIIMPIFLIIALISITKKTAPYVLRSISSYIIGVSIVLTIHYIACSVNNLNFLDFIKRNLILVDVHAYFPQLVTSIDNLIVIYLYIGIACLVSIIPLLIKNKKKWTPALVFLLFFNTVLSLKWLRWDWLDIDLYYQTISVFIALIIGIAIGLLVHYLKISIPKQKTTKAITLASLYAGILILAYISNSFLNYKFKKIDNLKTNTLLVYNNLSSDYLPFSYAVVNNNYGHTISKGEHHFINYSDFTNSYIKRDSVFEKIKNNKVLLKKQPEKILPNTVFVFIPEKEENIENTLKTPEDLKKDLLKTITDLKRKKRNVSIFFKDEFLTVYKIVNKKNTSNLNQLIIN